jgi:hypothetical protein
LVLKVHRVRRVILEHQVLKVLQAQLVLKVHREILGQPVPPVRLVG